MNFYLIAEGGGQLADRIFLLLGGAGLGE